MLGVQASARVKQFLSIARFKAVALWRSHPAAFGTASFAVAAALVMVFALASAARSNRSAIEELENLRATRKMESAQATRQVQPEVLRQAHDLPSFSSYEFTEQFHSVARDAGLPVDEVGYSMESSESKPYLRYRVNMTVKTRYLDVRKFIAALAAAMPHVTLDAIQCARENAAALPLTCQLTLSAFFEKA
jgi:Tfp pilus assembly protein PilO